MLYLCLLLSLYQWNKSFRERARGFPPGAGCSDRCLELPFVFLYAAFCFLFSPSLPLIPRTNLCFVTSPLSHYLPPYLTTPFHVSQLAFRSLSLHQVIVEMRSCCVADSWAR